MPRVKIDYIVSFSSEDSDHPANNLLSWEINKKKWLCSKGELSCSIVLQLTKAVEITRVDIGAYNVAILEVFVGLSEKPDSYEVLVPSCVLLTPGESRACGEGTAGGGCERVRGFARPDGLTDASRRRWDRVRVVCSQRYNKHCQYGLSFVHVFEPEGPTLAAPAPDSDEEEFKPGELFAASRRTLSQQTNTLSSTETQIRQASSRALKNVDDTNTKLVKTPIISKKNNHCRNQKTSDQSPADRGRASLIYTEDDNEQQNDKKEHEKRNTNERSSSLPVDRAGSNATDKTASLSSGKKMPRVISTPDKASSLKRSNSSSYTKTSNRNSAEKRKKDVDGTQGAEGAALRGCRVALSGFVAPRRGELRALALRLGALYHPDLARDTTHLICAFPNTPKVQAMRALRGACVAVTAGWLEDSRRRRAPAPWRHHAADPADRTDPDAGDPDRADPDRADGVDDEATPAECDSECDTDDEIERVLRARGAEGAAEPGQGENEGSATEGEEEGGGRERPHARAALPHSYDGLAFVIDERLALRGYDTRLLDRYIRAYGGIVLERSRVSEADYVVSCEAEEEMEGGARTLRPRDVWRARTAP